MKRLIVLGVAALFFGISGTAFAAMHAPGTNVVSNGTVYFIDSNNQLRPYTSAGAFLSYGNSWSNVVPANTDDLSATVGSFLPPRDGSLINDQGTIFFITDGKRKPITSPAVFTGLGFSWNKVIKGDTSFLQTDGILDSATEAHPAGALVNDNGTVYLVAPNQTKIGIPSPAVLKSWGYSFTDVVPANQFDMQLAAPPTTPAPTLGSGSAPSGSGTAGSGTVTSAVPQILSPRAPGETLPYMIGPISPEPLMPPIVPINPVPPTNTPTTPSTPPTLPPTPGGAPISPEPLVPLSPTAPAPASSTQPIQTGGGGSQYPTPTAY